MSLWDREDNQNNFKQIDQNYEVDQYSFNQNDNIPNYRTYISYEKENNTIQRFQTLMLKETNTKNIPKTFGNNFKKFMDNILMNQVQQNGTPIPQNMEMFLNKKNKGQQSTYNLKDFKALFNNEACSKWFQFYIQHCAFLDLIQSNRIENIEEYILFIEQYLTGAQNPEYFIKNRQQKKKEAAKQQKIQKKLDEMQLDNDSNIQLIF
ncbi:unnamed protein product [Paramecium primaurelia]|uniref:Uncharacterized protein n=1 Tax=Paramecium primaurelia TaxID=5886 RepID=A0A8S1KUG6_PARPR|nr:unnamed protein product [Paramecium primaurelia]